MKGKCFFFFAWKDEGKGFVVDFGGGVAVDVGGEMKDAGLWR